jgi:hypothetical protein
VDNRQRNHHYPQLSAKEEIKSPAIVVKASCNTLLTSLKRCLFNKEITVIQAQFSVDYGNMPAFQRRYAARRPEWSLCSRLAHPANAGQGGQQKPPVRILLWPTVLFPAEPTARQKKHDG